MAISLTILGQAKLGATSLGWPADLTDPPVNVRANGGCWGLVQDPAILEASMSADEAKADAVSKSEAAKLAAIEAATAIAEAKADAAQSAATSAAATDAQARATAARASAIAAAQIATDLAASGAKQEAIDAAKLDATAKANAAEVAAKNAAALDATAKANQAKTDATTAAANDATTKANNAQAAAISAAASDATAKAGLAKTEAVAAATTMTNGIGKNLSSASAPSTSNTAPFGSVWRRTDTNGRIIGAWEQTGAGVAGTWTPRLIDSQVIDNLDIGKLSASAATINTAVIQKLAVQIATIIELHADRITAGKLTSGQIDTPNLAAALATILELNANRITAGTINAARLDVNDLSARIATIIQLNADRITAGTVNTDRLNTNEIAARVATVIQLNAETIIAGTIATARLDVVDIASKTAAFQQVDVKNLFATTGTISELVAKKIWADLAIFNKVTTGMLAIGAFDNLVVDPDFTDTALRAQRIAASSATITSFGTSADNGRAHIIIPVSTSRLGFKMIATEPGRGTPVAPGATYRIRYQARTASGTAGTRAAVTYYKADGTSAFTEADSGAYATAGTSWQWVDYKWTAPDDAASAFFDVQRQAGLTGILWARTPQVTRMNAGELVVDGSIKAAHADLVSFAADTGFIADLTARIVKADMFVGKEFYGGVFTGSTFQTSILPNVGMKLDDAGLRAYGPEGGEPVVEISPNGGKALGVSAALTGEVLGGIDSEGNVSAKDLAVSGEARIDGVLVAGGDPLNDAHLGGSNPGSLGPVLNGRSLLGKVFANLVDDHPMVTDLMSWLDVIPHGVICNAWRGHVGTLTWRGLGSQEHSRIMMTATAQFVEGRAYSISYRAPGIRQIDTLTQGTVGYVTVRASSAGGSITPGGAGATIPGTMNYLASGGEATSVNGITYIRCPEDLPAGKVMLGVEATCYADQGMQSVDNVNSNRWEIVVTDMGLRNTYNAAKIVDLGKQGTAPPTPAPAPEPDPIRQYADTISPSWWKAYKGNGDDNTPSFNGKVTQGYSGYAPGNGVMRGMIGFPSQASRLSGATVKKIEVYVYAEHWHASAGGTLCIGVHTATSQPGTWSSSADDVKRQKMKKPEGRWITLPPSVHNGFKSGSNRGITLLPPGSSTLSEYYGYLVGSKTRLRVTYTK